MGEYPFPFPVPKAANKWFWLKADLVGLKDEEIIFILDLTAYRTPGYEVSVEHEDGTKGEGYKEPIQKTRSVFTSHLQIQDGLKSQLSAKSTVPRLLKV